MYFQIIKAFAPYILTVLLFSSLTMGVYIWHYKPIKNFKTELFDKDQLISVLKTEVGNSKELLRKCKEGTKIRVFETSTNTKADILNEMYNTYINGFDNMGEDLNLTNSVDKKDMNESTSNNNNSNINLIF